MGLRFSSNFSDSTNPHTVKVIAADGSLREFSSFVTVSDVLGSHFTTCFLCNSDSLTYNTYIPVLRLDTPLRPGKLYFILPVDILGSPLTGPDMAALAAKAVSALNSVSGKRCRRRRRFQVVQITGEVDEVVEENQELVKVLIKPSSARRQVRRSGSLRVRGAGVSSRVKLSTIEEVAE